MTSEQDRRLPLILIYLAVGLVWFLGVTIVIPTLTADVGANKLTEDASDVALFLVGAAFLVRYERRYRASVDRRIEERQAALRRFRSILDASPAAIIVIDDGGRIVEANGSVSNLGYHPSELIGKSEVILGGAVTTGAATTQPEPTTTNGYPLVTRKDGSTFPAEIYRTTIEIDGAPCVMFTIVDVSERRRMEAERARVVDALRESESRFRQIAESIRECFWLRSIESRELVYLSPAYEEIWGRPRPTNPDVSAIVEGVHPDDHDRVTEAIDRLRDVWPVPLEFRVIRPDGSVRWVRARRFPVADPSGAVRRFVGIAEDVTDERELGLRIQQYEKLEAIGQVTSGIVHDFTNVLTAIKGLADVIVYTSEPSDPHGDDARQITAAVDRATSLTRKLLTFSRRQVLEPRTVNLDELIDGLQPLLQRLVTERVQVVNHRTPGIGYVRVDPVHIEQALLNLLANARDAMPNGGQLTIETANVDLDERYAARHPGVVPGRYVRLSVTDTGIGMDDAARARAFDPFFTTKPPGEGTGLGLPSVYGVVKQSGGSTEILSEPGRGTTVRLFLPRVDAAVDPAEAANEPPADR